MEKITSKIPIQTAIMMQEVGESAHNARGVMALSGSFCLIGMALVAYVTTRTQRRRKEYQHIGSSSADLL
jgi:hypothetical protein